MREEESNWFSRWEEELPSPDELMPLSQTLITPDLALAFDIRNPNSTTINTPQAQAQAQAQAQVQAAAAAAAAAPTPPPPPCSSSAAPSPPPSQPHSSDFDSTDIVSTAPGDEPARTLKRPRLVWTPQLHKRFVDAVAHLGIKNAVPKTIMQLMSVDGLTRENVASHLQKYRLYLKRMQGLSSGGGGGNGALSPADAATDHLFASAPVPHHFLHPGRPPAASDHYLPFVQVAANLQHHHQQQMAAAAVVAQQQYHHRQVGQFGSPPGRQFEHGFITGQQQQQQSVHRMGSNAAAASPVPARQPSFLDDLENGAGGGGGRKVLTLFPTGDD